MMRMVMLVVAAALTLASPVQAQTARPEPDAREILQSAVAAAGGEAWLNPSTLYLAGRAVFYAPDSAEPIDPSTFAVPEN